MKVLVLSPPLSSAGGIQRYTRTLVRALREELGKTNVRCLALTESSSAGEQRGLSAKSKLSFIGHALATEFSWKPDLIICSHLAIGPIGWVIASIRRRPYWIFVYGIEAWGELRGSRAKSLERADRVFVISKFSRATILERHRIDASRIAILPCTVDEALIHLQPAENVLIDSIPEGSSVVLTVARMASNERYKGHDEALRALPSVIAKVPDLIYAVVGGGDDLPRLKRLTLALGLSSHVVFTGEVSDAELAALYYRSKVFLLPAKTEIDKRKPKGEGFGIVYLEAMVYGKPVVGPNFGAPVEVIQHGKTGLLVDPNDPESIACALIELLSHPELAHQMGNAGRQRVLEHFSYHSFTEKLHQELSDPAA